MKNKRFLLGFSAFLTLFMACRKETVAVQWTKNVVSPTNDWRGVQFFDAKNGVIIGGNTWTGGFALRTTNGGATLQSDSVQAWSLYGGGLDSKAQNTEGAAFYTVGISGQVFGLPKKDSVFQWVAHPFWKWFRDVAVRNGRGVSVGGQGWQGGILATFDVKNATKPYIDTFPQELESVAFADDSTVVAVGYGLVVRSTNAGRTWLPVKKLDADFYQSICFPSEKVGFMVGYSGSILTTNDGGASWSSLESASQFGAKHFRAVFFTDILRGLICGDDGLLWRTSDGGASWQVAEGLPNVNFYDVFAFIPLQKDAITEGWLVGAGGTIVKFSF